MMIKAQLIKFLIKKLWKPALIVFLFFALIASSAVATAFQEFTSIVGSISSTDNTESEAMEFDGKDGVLIGEFEITYYCTEKYPHICNAGPPYTTASGTEVTPNRTIAVDPDVIPLGTWVVIDGLLYCAEDTGGAIKGNRIDIAVATHEESMSKGREKKKVYRAYELNGLMTGNKLSNCGKDENGAYFGGKAGDQTGKEYHVIDWYSYPWDCVLRYEGGVNAALVRQCIATFATEAANNNNIGYDQSQRLTFWEQLSKVSSPSQITTPCEADCSSSTVAIIKKVGQITNVKALADISTSLTTYNLADELKKAGFKVYSSSEYVSSCSNLIAGDIVLNNQHHVAIYVS